LVLDGRVARRDMGKAASTLTRQWLQVIRVTAMGALQ
jgi:hypothetical protein